MFFNVDKVTFTSSVLLTIFIGTFLFWLIIKTLNEGKNALKEMKRDNK